MMPFGVLRKFVVGTPYGVRSRSNYSTAFGDSRVKTGVMIIAVQETTDLIVSILRNFASRFLVANEYFFFSRVRPSS